MEPCDETCIAPTASCSQLASEYQESCQRHNTPCIDSVLQQIRTLPDASIGGSFRAFRLMLSKCSLIGAAPAYALEAVLRKVQFRRLEMAHVAIDDEGVEALFDMITYYMSVTTISISGDWQFNFQAASKIIEKSCQLEGLEVVSHPLSPGHAPVLGRALRDPACRLRALRLLRARLCGEPLRCVVKALKSNNSVVELRLSDNGLTENDAAELSSLLRYNSRLQLLDLSDNQIMDVGASHIALALLVQVQLQGTPARAAPRTAPLQAPSGDAESRGLSVLMLSNNQLTNNCVQHLSKALRSSRTLYELNIAGNALGVEAVRSLQAAGPLVSLGSQPVSLTRADDRPQCARVAPILAPEAARPPTAEAARPSTAEAARPLTAEAARPSTAEAARLLTAEAARPSTAEAARPLTARRRSARRSATFAVRALVGQLQNKQRAGRKRSTQATLNNSKKRKKSSEESEDETECEDVEEFEVDALIYSDEEIPEAPTNGNRSESNEFTDVPEHFQSGNFVLLKSDIKWDEDKVTSKLDDFNVWKIEGRALMNKYIPVKSDGKIIYKCTCVYTGWKVENRDNYYSITDILDQNPKTDIKDKCVAFDLNDLFKVRDR